MVDARDMTQQIGKAGPAIARRGREVSASPKRLPLRCTEHGEGPSTLLAKQRQRGHVDGVDVGTFFSVDFYVDEQLVHDRRGRRVFEAFMGHDMAPMAGGVANRQQDRPVQFLGALQRLAAPWIPLDRIVGMLEQVGAGLVGEQVCGHVGFPAHIASLTVTR